MGTVHLRRRLDTTEKHTAKPSAIGHPILDCHLHAHEGASQPETAKSDDSCGLRLTLILFAVTVWSSGNSHLLQKRQVSGCSYRLVAITQASHPGMLSDMELVNRSPFIQIKNLAWFVESLSAIKEPLETPRFK